MRPFVPSSWEYNDRGTVVIESESVPGLQYFVGLKSLKCSCPHARKGHICKHARWVAGNRDWIVAGKQGGLFASEGGAL